MIYHRHPEKNRIYLPTLYGKSVKDDLTLAERKVWKRVVEEPEKNRIYLPTLYGKSVKDDLTLAERKVWKRVVEEIDNGQA